MLASRRRFYLAGAAVAVQLQIRAGPVPGDPQHRFPNPLEELP